MRIAVVTAGFNHEKPGGVSNVTLKVIEAIKDFAEIELVSFANEKNDPNSVQIFKPRTYRRIQPSQELYNELPLWRIGAIGSELEFLRYRKRKNLTSFFEKFDSIIIVTGILQMANVLPDVDIPVYVQCATRLKWERKSQYSSMPMLKRLALLSQIPFLSFQEFRVSRSKVQFLAENAMMSSWLGKRTFIDPIIWYPGIQNPLNYSLKRKSRVPSTQFISVGRFGDRRKGWRRLLQAYKLASDSCENLPPLFLLGWGCLDDVSSSELANLQAQYPITVLSDLSNVERDHLLNNSSIFLISSFEEGLGLAGIEAISFGLPILASDTYGSREYVKQGLNGKIVSQSKNFVSDFASAIVETLDWDLLSMSENSRKIFQEHFDKEVSEKKLIDLLVSQFPSNVRNQ